MPDNSINTKLLTLFSTSKPISIPKREMIIRAGETPGGVYYLKEGFIKMNSALPDGRELSSNIYKPGSYFPMMWAISNIPNSYYFQTITPSVVQRISKDQFIYFLQQNPDVLFDFTNRILVGLNGLMFNINYILSGDAYHRVVATILMLAKRFGDTSSKGQITIPLPLTHQDIADISALTRETASINIKLLENKKLISQDHQIIVNDIHKLEAIIDINDQESITQEL